METADDSFESCTEGEENFESCDGQPIEEEGSKMLSETRGDRPNKRKPTSESQDLFFEDLFTKSKPRTESEGKKVKTGGGSVVISVEFDLI